MILKASTGEYGDAVADFYDNFYRHYEDQYLIAEYCRSIHPEARRILEFGIGQGRLALSLARTGFEVTGIDSSPRMLERLKEQGEGLAIEAVHANFTDSLDLGDFDLVLIGTSTLFMVSTQEDQITTLRRAREHLGDDGRLIIDTYNPLARQRATHPDGGSSLRHRHRAHRHDHVRSGLAAALLHAPVRRPSRSSVRSRTLPVGMAGRTRPHGSAGRPAAEPTRRRHERHTLGPRGPLHGLRLRTLEPALTRVAALLGARGVDDDATSPTRHERR